MQHIALHINVNLFAFSSFIGAHECFAVIVLSAANLRLFSSGNVLKLGKN